MKKNLYYRTLYSRENILKNNFLSFFNSLSSYPRLLLEVFTRKDFGERYFRLSSALTVTFVLLILPFVPTSFKYASRNEVTLTTHLSWYIFTALFAFFSYQRHRETVRNPSVYDFAKFSLCSGTINPLFFKIQWAGKKPNPRFVETVLEPGLFFIAGILLWLLSQKVGILLTVSSIIYSLSYVAVYTAGDNFVLDRIDEIICNEELKKAFVDEASDEQTRGFRFMGRTPDDPEMRKKLLPLMTQEEESVVVK